MIISEKLAKVQLGGVVVTCNYPDDVVDANIPSELTLGQLYSLLNQLIESEPDMTSFVLTAAIRRTK